MPGKKQIELSIEVDVAPEAVFAVLGNSALLPCWAPAVERVLSHKNGQEQVGSLRRCAVNLAGRKGTIVERCTGIVENRSLSYVVDDESFGLRRMFDDYGFRLSLAPLDGARTMVTVETFYTARNWFYGLINMIMMRRQFERVVGNLLVGLKGFMENGDRTPTV